MAYEDVKAQLHGREREKVANDTWLEYGAFGEEDVFLYLHKYRIATFAKDYIRLSSTGLHTRTTKNRLNMVVSIAKIPNWVRIYQRNWNWYICLYSPGGMLLSIDIPFFDGIKLNYEGEVIP